MKGKISAQTVGTWIDERERGERLHEDGGARQ